MIPATLHEQEDGWPSLSGGVGVGRNFKREGQVDRLPAMSQWDYSVFLFVRQGHYFSGYTACRQFARSSL